jgi:hypothetical protein
LRAGKYQITLSEAAWIDAIQGGNYRRPSAFTGVLECTGARKSVRFDFDGAPLILQMTAVASDQISFTVRRIEE